MTPIKTISFVINLSKPQAMKIAEELSVIAKEKRIETNFITEYPLDEACLNKTDLCCVIGGDGTLLGVLKSALASNTKILGINLGKLGFLATFNINSAKEHFSSILEGQYTVEQRSVIHCQNSDGDFAYALNDLVLKDIGNRGLIRLKVKSNDELVSEYHCDGLIFATPTGSTAYNLSAGGPIISPKVEAIVMTPICPHTLGNRSVIFDAKTPIEVYFDTKPANPIISLDGKKSFDLKPPFTIKIQLSENRFQLIQNSQKSHFSIVRDKLNWGDPTIR